MTSQIDELLDRRATYITRWHHRPVRQHESVAEHQWSTAFIAMVLARYLANREWSISIAWTMQIALLHDQVEIITGDVPHPFKSATPERKAEIDAWEREAGTDLFSGFDDKMGDWLRSLATPSTRTSQFYEAEIVELADKLSAFAFAEQEVAQGNSLFEPIVAHTAGLCLSILAEAEWGDAVCDEVRDLPERLRRARRRFGSGV